MRKSKRKIHKALKRINELNVKLVNAVRIGRADLVELYTSQLNSAKRRLDIAEAKALKVY
ncbi:MAG: hypothetical protein F4227_03155 [Gammaproteobacteria bacterium]|nr:hypothetical protein [Gammaproteobacteria bacterium]MYF01993.1 hypothetical protein [Gammaproteobacteria bacterium]MYI77199.1 hypothetical protein [Gammaproteobacteria bacterium]